MDAIYITRLDTAFAATTGYKTILKLVTTSAFKIEILELALFTDGVTSSAVPASWSLFTSDETTAGTGSGTAVTTQIKGRTQAHGLTVTQKHSAEGTTYAHIKRGFIPQFMGTLIIPNPLGTEEQSPSDAADSIGIGINVTAAVNVDCWLKWARA